MPKRSPAHQLDLLVEAVLAGPGPKLAPSGHETEALAPLLRIAQDLKDLPRENFKTRLKSDLERKTSMASLTESVAAVRQTATPRLRLRNAAAAIDFYKKAFGAGELMRFVGHGQIGHAEIVIGNTVIMLGEEALEHGFPSPESLGGSPVSIHLYVDDADALVQQAVAAGARLVSPVRDQFYGDRSGSVADPFGYTWTIATRKEHLSVEEMQRRFAALPEEQEERKAAPSPKGHNSVTPYLIAQDAPALIDFVKRVFDGKEAFRTIGSAGGIHCEVRVGDSTLMMGGGGPGLSWHADASPAALHVFVKDTDAVYQRALDAGAESINAPADQFYGERSGSVKDQAGNHWYIATSKGESHIPEGLHTVNPCLHPLRAEPVINFLKRSFGAEELQRYASPDGVIHHARIRLGESIIEMGEAHGPYQPMPSTFLLQVSDVDATYSRAIQTGAIPVEVPANQPRGGRTASVKDVFGNRWYIAGPASK